MEIREGWVVLLVLAGLMFGLVCGAEMGMNAKCNNAWLAAHNAADSAMVRRVCKVTP